MRQTIYQQNNHDYSNTLYVENQTPNCPQTYLEYFQDDNDDDEEKICIGNDDEEFLPLVKKRIFKNNSGK